MKSSAFYAFLIAFGITLYARGQVIFVNHAASGSNNGTSWTNAYNLVQDAIDNASSGDSIFIAKGTYLPTTILGSTNNRVSSDFENRVVSKNSTDDLITATPRMVVKALS